MVAGFKFVRMATTDIQDFKMGHVSILVLAGCLPLEFYLGDTPGGQHTSN